MRNAYRLIMAFSLAAGSLPVAAWVPVDCGARMPEVASFVSGKNAQEIQNQWATHLRMVHEAKPGDTNYAPHPEPKTPDEVIEDFLYVYFQKLFDEGPAELDPGERAIYKGLQGDDLDLRVERVENWSVSRCDPDHEMPFFHLVRLFDAEGEELARATVLPSGLLGEYAQVTSVASRGLVPPSDVAGEVFQMLGRKLPAHRAQYATIDGLPLHCGRLTPCTVFEAEGSTWILDRAALLFEVSPHARHVSVTQVHAKGWRGMQATLEPGARRPALVSEGFGWVEARQVAEDPEMARVQGMKR